MDFILFGVGFQEKKSVFGRIVSGSCSHPADFPSVWPHRFPPRMPAFPMSGRTFPVPGFGTNFFLRSESNRFSYDESITTILTRRGMIFGFDSSRILVIRPFRHLGHRQTSSPISLLMVSSAVSSRCSGGLKSGNAPPRMAVLN